MEDVETMEEKVTAVYLMARESELKPEHGGSYDRILEEQKQRCVRFLQERFGDDGAGPVEFYQRRKQLFMDIDRQKIARVVVESLDRLGTSPEELDGIQFELKAAGVELLTID